MHHCENFCSAIASALAKQEAVLSQLHEDLNMKTDNLQVSNTSVFNRYMTLIIFALNL